MPAFTTAKLIIVALTLTTLPLRQAGSMPDTIGPYKPTQSRIEPQLLCSAPTVRICRAIPGQQPAFLAQTPRPARIRLN